MLLDVTIQPVMFVLLFAYVFGSSIDVADRGRLQAFLLPGIMAQTVAFSSFIVAVGLTADLEKGIVDRMRSLPINPAAVLVGRIVLQRRALLDRAGGDVADRPRDRLADPHQRASRRCWATLLLVGWAFAMIWVGILVGSAMRSVEAVNGVMFATMFPITFLANTFAPTDGMPSWLRFIAEWNPISSLTQAVRELWGNDYKLAEGAAFPMHHPIPFTIGWIVLITAMLAPLAIRTFRNAHGRLSYAPGPGSARLGDPCLKSAEALTSHLRCAIHEADLAATPDGDAPTRDRVARSILENGPSTAADLAARLDLTPAAVRRHLDHLTEDGTVEARDQKVYGHRGRGRPAKVFALTDAGRDALRPAVRRPRRAGAALPGRDRRRRRRHGVRPSPGRLRRARLRHRDRAEDPTLSPAEALARVFTAEGYAARVRHLPIGDQLCQQHCPVSHVAHEFPQLCEAETEAIGRVLGTHVQRLATIAHGDGVCTTCIPTSITSSSTQKEKA